MATEWPAGVKHAHHAHEAELAQRRQSLVHRDHHTAEEHTLPGPYAGLDEAFTRLEALELPTAARRLAMLRKRAARQVIRRQYVREANWLVHHNAHFPYRRHMMLHTKYPDRYAEPSTDGLVLTDADKARIGPTADDVGLEEQHLIAGLRPHVVDLLAQHAIGRSGAVSKLRAQVAAGDTIRRRARLLRAIGSIRDDYFETNLWSAAHTDELRTYCYLAALSPGVDPETNASYVVDPENLWHTAASRDLGGSVQDADLLAACRAFAAGLAAADSEPRWKTPYSDLPEVTVTGGTQKINLAWAGSIRAQVSLQVTVIPVNSALDVGSAVTARQTTAGDMAVPTVQGVRAAVLLQWRWAPHPSAALRTVGSVTVVDVAEPD